MKKHNFLVCERIFFFLLSFFFLPKDGETHLLVDSQHRERQCNKRHLFLCKPYIPKVTEEQSEDGGTVRTVLQVEGRRRSTREEGLPGAGVEGHACFL